MKPFHAIDDLIFDFSFSQGQMEESALSEWISSSIPALIDEVMEQSDPGAGIYRIEKLEIDLGEMTEEELPTELPRRLYAQLSSALSMPRERATEPAIIEEIAADDKQYLEDFLRTGQLAWIASTHPREAHIQLLERVLKSNNAANTMRKIVANEQMRLRLLLQFGEKQLFKVLEKLLAHWPTQLAFKVKKWAQLELASHSTSASAAQTYWQWLYQLSAGQTQEMAAALHSWSENSNKTSNELLAQYQQYLEKNKPMPERDQISLSALFGEELIEKMRVANSVLGKQADIQSRQKEITGKSEESITVEVAARQDDTYPAAQDTGKKPTRQTGDTTTNQSGENASLRQKPEKPSVSINTTPATTDIDKLYQALCAGDWLAIKPHWQQLVGQNADLLRRAQAQGWAHWLKNFPAEQLRVASQILQPRASWILERILSQFQLVEPGQAKLWFERSLPILLAAKPSSLLPDALLTQMPPLRDIAAHMGALQKYLPQNSSSTRPSVTANQHGIHELKDAHIDTPPVNEGMAVTGNKKTGSKTIAKTKTAPPVSTEKSGDTTTALAKSKTLESDPSTSVNDTTANNAAISMTQLYKALENADLAQLNPHWEKLLLQHDEIIRQAQSSAWPAWLSVLPPQKLHDLCLVLQARATFDLEELIGKLSSSSRQPLLASAIPLLLQAVPDSVHIADLLTQLPQLRTLEQDSIAGYPKAKTADQVSRTTKAFNIDVNAQIVTGTDTAANDADADADADTDASAGANADVDAYIGADTNVHLSTAMDIAKLGVANASSKQNSSAIEFSALSTQLFEALSTVDIPTIREAWTSAGTEKIDRLRQVWPLIHLQRQQEILRSLDVAILMEWVQILQPKTMQLTTELQQQANRLAQVAQVLLAYKNSVLSMEATATATTTAIEATADTSTADKKNTATSDAVSVTISKSAAGTDLPAAEVVEQYAQLLQRKAMQYLLKTNTESEATIQVIEAMLSDQAHAADIVHIWKKLPDLEQQAKQLHQALQNWPLPDQVTATQNPAKQQADADTDATSAAPERHSIPAPADIKGLGKNQDFSNFRLWVQGQLSIWTLELSIDQLQQWLRWWFASNGQQDQDHQLLFLQSIISYCEQAQYPALFLKLVLTQLQQDKEIDLDHLKQESLSLASQDATALQSGFTPSMADTNQSESRLHTHVQTQNTAVLYGDLETDIENGFNPESESELNVDLIAEHTPVHLFQSVNPLLSSDLGKNLLLWLSKERHGLDTAKDVSDQHPEFTRLLVQLKQDSSILNACNSAQLHQLLLDYLELEYGPQTRQHFLQSIERYALQSADLQTYFRMVLQDLLAQKIIDLEQILAMSQDADIQLKAQAISAYFSNEFTDNGQLHHPTPTTSTTTAYATPETRPDALQVKDNQDSEGTADTQTVPDMLDIIALAQVWNTPALHFWLSQLLMSTPQLRAMQTWLVALETQIKQVTDAKSTVLLPYLLLQILMHRQADEQQQLAFRQAILQYFPYSEDHLQTIAAWLSNDAQALELQEKIEFCLAQADAEIQDTALQGDDAIAAVSKYKSVNKPGAEAHEVTESQANEMPEVSDERSNEAHVLYEAIIPGVTPRKPSPQANEPPDRSVQQLMPNLPHRIAQAMLQANMDSLAPVWAHLMTAERSLLEQGLRRYMVRPEEQRRLLAQTNHDKLRDLIHVLQHQAGSMLDVVWANWNTCQASANPSISTSALKEKILAVSLSNLLDSTSDAFQAEIFLKKLLATFVHESSTDAAILSLAQSWLAHFNASRPEALFAALNALVYGRGYLRVLQQRILPPADLQRPELSAHEAEDRLITATATPTAMEANDTGTNRELIIATLSNEFPQLMQEFLQELEHTDLEHVQFAPEEWQHLLYAVLNQFPSRLQASFWKQWEEKFFPAEIQQAASDMGMPDPSFMPAGQALLWSAIPEDAYKTSLQDLLFKSKQVAEYVKANAAPVSQAASPQSSGVSAKPLTYTVKKHALDATSAVTQTVLQALKAPQQSDLERLAFILQRNAEPDAEQKIIFVLLTQKLLENNTAALKNIASEVMSSALNRPQAMRRLLDILPPLVLKNLLEKLLPVFSQALPTLFAKLERALEIAVPPLTTFVWRIVYENIFVHHIKQPGTAFTQAMVRGLAKHYQATDISDWLRKTDEAALQVLADAASAPAGTSSADGQNASTTVPVEKSGDASPPKTIQPGKDKRQLDQIPDRADINVDNIHIHNGGLILLAPYIQRLFDILELTRDGNFVDEQSAQRSVHLLQFIVTGELETPEYQLVLNKLLCGIKGGTPICSGISILDREKEVIEQMLEGVIANWGALGGSSIAALRETFLQRQAHLYRQDDAWHMKVLPGTFDMLLDRLPWSFALTRFPWMEEPIHTTWRG